VRVNMLASYGRVQPGHVASGCAVPNRKGNGEGGIRTRGTQWAHWFSKPARSATPTPLRTPAAPDPPQPRRGRDRPHTGPIVAIQRPRSRQNRPRPTRLDRSGEQDAANDSESGCYGWHARRTSYAAGRPLESRQLYVGRSRGTTFPVETAPWDASSKRGRPPPITVLRLQLIHRRKRKIKQRTTVAHKVT
jgi:hypothetical protein